MKLDPFSLCSHSPVLHHGIDKWIDFLNAVNVGLDHFHTRNLETNWKEITKSLDRTVHWMSSHNVCGYLTERDGDSKFTLNLNNLLFG